MFLFSLASAHDSLFTSTEFLAQRFIHCFVTIGFVLFPTMYFSKRGNVLSLSLSPCVFAHSPISFPPAVPHRRKSYTYVALPRYLSASSCAKRTRKRTHSAHCVYTCRGSTRAFGNVSVHRRSKVSDRVCRDSRRYGVDRRERTRFSRVYAVEWCSPRALSRIPEEEPAAQPCY